MLSVIIARVLHFLDCDPPGIPQKQGADIIRYITWDSRTPLDRQPFTNPLLHVATALLFLR